MGATRGRTQRCDREQALIRLDHAESFIAVADLVVATDDEVVATAGVAASLAVLAGIAASDAACCVRLQQRARGQDHRDAVDLLQSVRPHGEEMAKHLKRLLVRKDDAHYGMQVLGAGDARRMVEWAERLTSLARRVVETA